MLNFNQSSHSMSMSEADGTIILGLLMSIPTSQSFDVLISAMDISTTGRFITMINLEFSL